MAARRQPSRLDRISSWRPIAAVREDMNEPIEKVPDDDSPADQVERNLTRLLRSRTHHVAVIEIRPKVTS